MLHSHSHSHSPPHPQNFKQIHSSKIILTNQNQNQNRNQNRNRNRNQPSSSQLTSIYSAPSRLQSKNLSSEISSNHQNLSISNSFKKSNSIIKISNSINPTIYNHHQNHHLNHPNHHINHPNQQNHQNHHINHINHLNHQNQNHTTNHSIIRKGHQFGLALNDFDVIRVLGTGTFGKVLLVKLISNDQIHSNHYFAMKVLVKSQVVKLKQVEHMNSEKNLLALVSSTSSIGPKKFCVSLFCTFQDERNLYMLMEFVQGGELFSHLRRAGRFLVDVARFFAANVLLALEGLHQLDIVYRDLKPENILLASNGYIKLTDFGFAKRVPDRTWTLCGTPEYLAPEIIQSKGHGKPADWWAFGILIFEMLVGYPPFFNSDGQGPFGIYEKILACHLIFPQEFNPSAMDLVKKLLIADRSKRIGNLKGGINDIKDHDWFKGVDWNLLLQQLIPAPIIPKISKPSDSSNFEYYPAAQMDDLPGIQRGSRPLSYDGHQYNSNQSDQDIDPYGYLFESF